MVISKFSTHHLFTLIVFLATLRSFLLGGLSFLSLGAFVLCVMFVIFNIRVIKVEGKHLNLISYFIFLISFAFIGTLYYGIDIDGKRLIGVVVVCGTVILTPFLLKYFTSDVFKTVIIIHLVFYYFQLIFYYFFGVYLDFLILNENSSRNLGGVFVVPYIGLPLMRASGLFSEPGTYSNFMFLLYVAHTLTAKESKDLLQGKWLSLLILSLMTTFSSFGLIFACCIILSRLRNVTNLILPITLFVVVVSPYFVDRFISKESGREDSGIEFRVLYLKDTISNFESVQGWMVGKGAMSVPTFFQGGDGSDNDTGLIIYLLREFGPIFCFFILLPIILSQIRYGLSLLLCISLFVKIAPFSFFIPLFYVVTLSNYGKKPNRSEHIKEANQQYG
ncbi:hypothetical protein [Pseudoalteromonas piscicida]|uniref:O-antigen ligase domain-containing protein n=1 Tax=Pseudoalteromonas piscicida TaxID=43662 RepID=A0A2A5JW81_PSEO7|nr:hypothetical protein [Pseudoalteromonas piscicida]PCK33607.1 hypothetical protein CEX98_00895 [Pseudoalteromonas piscicida]